MNLPDIGSFLIRLPGPWLRSLWDAIALRFEPEKEMLPGRFQRGRYELSFSVEGYRTVRGVEICAWCVYDLRSRTAAKKRGRKMRRQRGAHRVQVFRVTYDRDTMGFTSEPLD